MPNNKIWKKSLVVGIIVLFIGVGFQPAFANEVSITNKSEVEEDCDCQPVSNLHLIRLERMLNRLEIHTKILSFFSKYNPEFAEKYQEISNRISTLKETNNELNNELKLDSLDGESPILCSILEILNTTVGYIAEYIIYYLEKEAETLMDIILQFISEILLVPIFFIYFYIRALGYSAVCWEFPDL